MLVHIKEIMRQAVKGKYAVGAFNINNLEILLSVVRAAVATRSPAIIQVTEGAIKYAGLAELFFMIKQAVDEAPVPFAVHLDHGHEWPIIKKAIDIGFSSVMIDASHLPYEKNIRLTSRVVKYAHARGVWVQAELGRLEGAEDWQKVGAKQAYLTDPQSAAVFVKQTGVDTFAPAVGNYHGVAKITQKKKICLDLIRLKKIAKIMPVPLVLHGASGLPSALIKKVVQEGVRIINIDSELRVSFTRSLRNTLARQKASYDPRQILGPSIAAMQKTAAAKMKIFGSAGRILK